MTRNNMKKILFTISILLIASLCLFLVACDGNAAGGVAGTDGASGASATQSGITATDASYLDFYPLDDGTLGVKAGKTIYLSEVEIPATYDGKTVSTILPQAFRLATNLQRITIPASVTSIGEDAFEGCTNLKSITFYSSLTDIAPGAFAGSGLKYINYQGTKSQWATISDSVVEGV